MPQPAALQHGPATTIASLLIVLVLAAMLLAWGWALSRLATGRPLLPPPRPRTVPWGVGSILLLIVAWYVTHNVVVAVHYQITGRFGSGEPRAIEVATGPAEEGAEQAEEATEQAEEPEPPPWTERDVLVITGSLALLMIPQIIFILRRTSGASLEDLGLTAHDVFRNIGRGVVACLLLAPVCYGMIFVLSKVWTPRPHDLESMLRNQFSGGTAVLAFVSAVVIAPVIEELSFRGVVLPWFERIFGGLRGPREARPGDRWVGAPIRRESEISHDPQAAPSASGPIDDAAESSVGAWPVPPGEPPTAPPRTSTRPPSTEAQWLANIATSAIFASLHAPQWPAPLPLFVLSIGLGLLIQRTGSLWAPIALHATFNGLSTTALILSMLVGGDEAAGEAKEIVPPPAVAMAGSLVVDLASPSISHLNAEMNLGDDQAPCYGWASQPLCTRPVPAVPGQSTGERGL